MSPYYWWFRLLQLNDEYARAVDGKRSKISKQVIADFGDVRGLDFYEWWDTHAYLFAEPISNLEMKVATNAKDLAPFASTDAINLVVPLSWSRRELIQSFEYFVGRLVPDQQGQLLLKNTKAKYRLGRKWSIKALMEACRVIRCKKEADIKFAETGKKTAWADIGIKAKLSFAEREKMKVGDTKDVDRRITLTILTTRCYARALKFLEASVTTSFPA